MSHICLFFANFPLGYPSRGKIWRCVPESWVKFQFPVYTFYSLVSVTSPSVALAEYNVTIVNVQLISGCQFMFAEQSLNQVFSL